MDWYSRPRLTGQEATVQDGGDRPLYPVKLHPVPIKEEIVWAPESVWTVLREKKTPRPWRDSNPGSSSLWLVCIHIFNKKEQSYTHFGRKSKVQT